MTNNRAPGLLDPLIDKFPQKQAIELARALGVNRKTVYKWQRKRPISNYNKLRLNMLCLSLGIPPIFKEIVTAKQQSSSR